MERHIPVWQPLTPGKRYPTLGADLAVDAVVIGAGITGLTLALQLKNAGLTVVVLEMRAIGDGATGSSTGHLTAALDLSYVDLTRRFGTTGAAEAASKSVGAIAYIRSIVESHGIACGFSRVDGWRFDPADTERSDLDAERDAARAAGLAVELVDAGPLPFMGRALRFPDQAMIDPAAYVRGLAELVDGGHGRIFEGTRVERVVEGDPCRVECGRHHVTAAVVIEATHVPIGVNPAIQARLAPYMTYVVAAALSEPMAPGLYWDTGRPYHYLRPATAADGSPLVLVGGEDRKVGQDPDPGARFAALEAYVSARFPVRGVVARWGAEVLEPADGLPYVGRVGTNPRIQCATGLSGTGLTFGTAAALDLASLLLDPDAEDSVFRADRYKPIAAARNFVVENANVAWNALRDAVVPPPVREIQELHQEDGGLAELEGEKVAAFRTETGRLVVLSPICTHMGGRLRWNAEACTWDCPLHGSRFLATGEVLCGPATQPLAPGGTLTPTRECTVSDLVATWQEKGYTCDLVAGPGGLLRCRAPGHEAAPARGRVDAFHRLEGMSDPDEMCMVVATSLPREGAPPCKGVLVLGFGPAGSPEDKQVITTLDFDTAAAAEGCSGATQA